MEAAPSRKKRTIPHQSSLPISARRTVGLLFVVGIVATFSICASVIYSLHKAASGTSGLASHTSSSSSSRLQRLSASSSKPAADPQQHDRVSSSSSGGGGSCGRRSSHAPQAGVFTTQHAGIQRYTLWGSTNTSAAVVLHLWIRFICTSDGTTARGFAVAEEVNQPLHFYINHPLIPDPIAQNLPQLQLQTEDSTAAWNFTQIHVPYLYGQYPNVVHFHAKLPKDANPARIGVHGWERSVDVYFPGNSGNSDSCPDTTQAASEQLAWRQHGTIWSVVSPGAGLSVDVHAFAICEHIMHHKQLNMSGMLAMLEGPDRVEHLMAHSCIRRAVEEGVLHFWIWVSVHTGSGTEQR
jgi:hypothetical protein